jgi:hypothetical protein
MEYYSDSSDSHPFLLVRHADIFILLGSGPVVDLYYQVKTYTI